jgi:hypothetical protein
MKLLKFNNSLLTWQNYYINLYCFYTNKNLKFKIALQSYYIYKLKNNKMFFNILTKQSSFIKIKGYQYIYPNWNYFFTNGLVSNIKNNNINTNFLLNYNIHNYKMKKIIFLKSPLIIYIYNYNKRNIYKYIKKKITNKKIL